jgi:hypothetical protein
MKPFSDKAIRQLRSYVYLYVDPRNGRPFYVGKGRGNRCFAHLRTKDSDLSAKSEVLAELRQLGKQPRIEILAYGMSNDEALLVERAAIDLLGLESLTNVVNGHSAGTMRRAPVEEISARLDAKPVTVDEPVMLININRNYRPGMTIHEIYDATRCAWVLGPKRERAKYALSVFRGIVREVFEIAAWLEGGSTMKGIDIDGYPNDPKNRWEFVGRAAPMEIRDKYIGRSVANYFPQGAQGPVRYVNCD